MMHADEKNSGADRPLGLDEHWPCFGPGAVVPAAWQNGALMCFLNRDVYKPLPLPWPEFFSPYSFILIHTTCRDL